MLAFSYDYNLRKTEIIKVKINLTELAYAEYDGGVSATSMKAPKLTV